MTPRITNPAGRFSNRVEHYVRYRPGYPSRLVPLLEHEAQLRSDAVVADVGSGTGRSAEPFLQAGYRVIGVEPNPAMREAAGAWLREHDRFASVAGTAEAVPLADRSVDLVLAGQAFHWFDAAAARREFARILVPDGRLVLVWNSRRTEETPFLRDLEALLLTYGTDYREVNHRQVDVDRVAPMFAGGAFTYHALDNRQALDREGLIGRVASASYVPARGEPGHDEMCAALSELFGRYQAGGQVVIEYDTEIYVGRIERAGRDV